MRYCNKALNNVLFKKEIGCNQYDDTKRTSRPGREQRRQEDVTDICGISKIIFRLVKTSWIHFL